MLAIFVHHILNFLMSELNVYYMFCLTKPLSKKKCFKFIALQSFVVIFFHANYANHFF